VACVQSAFVRRLDDFAVNGNLPQATERAFLDCQIEENALYTTAVASGPGHVQAIALIRAAIEQLKANLKAEMLAPPPAMKNSTTRPRSASSIVLRSAKRYIVQSTSCRPIWSVDQRIQ